MQGAAAIALLAGQYSQALDIKKRKELSLMYWSTIASFLIMVYTRGIHYWWMVYRLLYVVYAKGDFYMFAISGTIMILVFPILGMTVFPFFASY